MGDLESVIEGLSVAAEALGKLAAPGAALPFVSGNVSLYNQVGTRGIPPSPIVMCAGIVREISTAIGLGLRRAGNFLVLVGEPRGDVTGSAFVREILGERGGAPPPLDLEHEARLQELAVLAAEGRWVRAAHDVSEGGLLVALAEMLLAAPHERGVGVEVDFGALEADTAMALFCERPGIVFEVSPERAPRLFQSARERSLLAWPIGAVSDQPVLRARLPGDAVVSWTCDELREAAARPLSQLWNEELS
jgi:phosphoribosylformylglycinamidine synthase